MLVRLICVLAGCAFGNTIQAADGCNQRGSSVEVPLASKLGLEKIGVRVPIGSFRLAAKQPIWNGRHDTPYI